DRAAPPLGRSPRARSRPAHLLARRAARPFDRLQEPDAHGGARPRDLPFERHHPRSGRAERPPPPVPRPLPADDRSHVSPLLPRRSRPTADAFARPLARAATRFEPVVHGRSRLDPLRSPGKRQRRRPPRGGSRPGPLLGGSPPTRRPAGRSALDRPCP